MFKVPPGQIAKIGKTQSGVAVPVAIDLTCPWCRTHVSFTFAQWSPSEVRGLPKRGRCPRCHAEPTFIRLGDTTVKGMRVYVDAVSPDRPSLAGLDQVPDDR